MNLKCTAIILRLIKYTDHLDILEVYARERGRLSVLVKHRAERKSTYRSSIFRPLNIVALEIAISARSGLSKLISAESVYPFHQLQMDVYKSSICMFLCECLYHAVREETDNQPLFDYLEASLKWLEQAGRKQTANFHIVFLMRLTRFIGIYPNLEGYKKGVWFDMNESSYTPRKPWKGSYLEPSEAAWLPLLSRMNYYNLHRFKLSRSGRVRILELLILYYRIHLPGFPMPQSFSILQELFE